MGRELRRVPLDFDWPLNQVWQGYVAPEHRPCPSDDCVNGATVAGDYLQKIAHLIMMLADASERPVHPWLAEIPLTSGRKPGPDAVVLTTGLAGRSPPFMGHDACDQWAATKKIMAAAGVPGDWGTCQVCGGHAIHPDDLEAFEAHEETEPPSGDGYQLWETTSEGSPITPVFETLDALCDHAARYCTTFASTRVTSDEWRVMLDEGFVHHDQTLSDGTQVTFI